LINCVPVLTRLDFMIPMHSSMVGQTHINPVDVQTFSSDSLKIYNLPQKLCANCFKRSSVKTDRIGIDRKTNGGRCVWAEQATEAPNLMATE
jgi:hypothetical protein